MLTNHYFSNIIYKKLIFLRGGVKFPTGSKSLRALAERVQFPYRRYSPDGRRKVCFCAFAPVFFGRFFALLPKLLHDRYAQE